MYHSMLESDLHQRLVALQPTSELIRKQRKARTKHYWTQEDLDCADREGKELYEALHFTDECETFSTD